MAESRNEVELQRHSVSDEPLEQPFDERKREAHEIWN